MVLTLLRVVLGFLVACLVAGLAIVMFVLPPTEIMAMPEAVRSSRLGDVGMLSLAAATQSAMFAAPFALVAAAVAEWQGLRGILYYALIGLAISAGGFVALFASEVDSHATIINSYASAAYAVSGLLGGIAYWLVAGRYAGEPQVEDDPALPSTLTPPPKINRPAAAMPSVRPGPTGPTTSTTPAVPQRRVQ